MLPAINFHLLPLPLGRVKPDKVIKPDKVKKGKGSKGQGKGKMPKDLLGMSPNFGSLKVFAFFSFFSS